MQSMLPLLAFAQHFKREYQVADPKQQANLVGRAAFWIVAAAIFVSIGVLPGALLGWWYYTGGVVHMRVVPVVAVLFLILWLVATFLGGRPRAKHSS